LSREDPSDERDDRAAWAKGWALGAEIVGLSLQFVLPALVGFLVDQWLQSLPVGTVVGALLGLATAALGFIRLIRGLEERNRGR